MGNNEYVKRNSVSSAQHRFQCNLIAEGKYMQKRGRNFFKKDALYFILKVIFVAIKRHKNHEKVNNVETLLNFDINATLSLRRQAPQVFV